MDDPLILQAFPFAAISISTLLQSNKYLLPAVSTNTISPETGQSFSLLGPASRFVRARLDRFETMGCISLVPVGGFVGFDATTFPAAGSTFDFSEFGRSLARAASGLAAFAATPFPVTGSSFDSTWVYVRARSRKFKALEYLPPEYVFRSAPSIEYISAVDMVTCTAKRSGQFLLKCLYHGQHSTKRRRFHQLTLSCCSTSRALAGRASLSSARPLPRAFSEWPVSSSPCHS